MLKKSIFGIDAVTTNERNMHVDREGRKSGNEVLRIERNLEKARMKLLQRKKTKYTSKTK